MESFEKLRAFWILSEILDSGGFLQVRKLDAERAQGSQGPVAPDPVAVPIDFVGLVLVAQTQPPSSSGWSGLCSSSWAEASSTLALYRRVSSSNLVRSRGTPRYCIRK